ncbi:MAG: hypothetical protein KDA05_09350 [Phycisphaerales bacterium]|nr:hypothetical protein [Phycisphaerales bacterium]
MTRRHARSRARHALALVEVVVSVAILGGLMGAVMTAVGTAALTRTTAIERTQGAALAESLTSEILAKLYDDPGTPAAPLVTGTINLGPIVIQISSPGGSASRSAFDSIDDFNNWSCSPPVDRNGSVMVNFEGWTRTVRVERVARTDPAGTAIVADQGLKRITVTVTRRGREVARVVTLRSRAWGEALDAR